MVTVLRYNQRYLLSDADQHWIDMDETLWYGVCNVALTGIAFLMFIGTCILIHGEIDPSVDICRQQELATLM
jgi:hypothetical protein